MLYGAYVWDPKLIIAQIFTIQCLFYLSLGLWHFLLVGPVVGHLTAGWALNWRFANVHSRAGLLSLLANLVNAPVTGLAIAWAVQRSRKCLDFSSTCYIWHFVVCTVYAGLPRGIEWWGVNSLCLVVCALLSEWICVRWELRDIPLGMPRTQASRARTSEVQLPVSSLATKAPTMAASERTSLLHSAADRDMV